MFSCSWTSDLKRITLIKAKSKDEILATPVKQPFDFNNDLGHDLKYHAFSNHDGREANGFVGDQCKSWGRSYYLS